MSSEEQDRMGTEETVHIKINRRRSQMWHQWFGLGSLSPHSGAGSGFRIRSGLGLGFRMDTWIRSIGSILPGEDPDPRPCPHNPIKPEIVKYSNPIGFQIIQIIFFPFCLGPQRHNY